MTPVSHGALSPRVSVALSDLGQFLQIRGKLNEAETAFSQVISANKGLTARLLAIAQLGLARVGALEHFPTDVVAGAVIGELIGQYVVHHHAQLADQ